MDLKTLITAIDRLPADELEQLRQYIAQRHEALQQTPQERITVLNAAFAAIREGLTEEELGQMIADMNGEYIEPDDEDSLIWRDELAENKK